MIIEQIRKFPANRNSSFPDSYSSLLIELLGKTINFMQICQKRFWLGSLPIPISKMVQGTNDNLNHFFPLIDKTVFTFVMGEMATMQSHIYYILNQEYLQPHFLPKHSFHSSSKIANLLSSYFLASFVEAHLSFTNNEIFSGISQLHPTQHLY